MTDQSFSIVVDDGVCMGAGYCYRSYPRLFEEGADGTSATTGVTDPELLDDAKKAGQICPSGAIEIHQREDSC